MRAILSVFIPTLNEEANLSRCLAKLAPLDINIFVVDSNSTDRTAEIARAAGCQFVAGTWNTFSDKINWALSELPIVTPWVLRVDADEWLTTELVAELHSKLAGAPPDVAAYALKYRVHFLNRWIRHGGCYPLWKVNLYRHRKARCEVRELDEQMVIDGRIAAFDNDVVDENLSGLTAWTAKHNRYSDLELVEACRARSAASTGLPREITSKRWLREHVYYRMPPFIRPLGYWVYRYLLRGGFLDGMPGLIFHTLHAFWYRFLVDAKLYERQIRER